jgi:hypothetical protein
VGTGGSLPGVRRQEHEADHSPPSSAEVKNAWSCTYIATYVVMSWCLVKHRDSFNFTTFIIMKFFFAEKGLIGDEIQQNI